MRDIEEEAEGDDANAAPEKGKGKSRSRKEEDDGFWLKVSVVLYFPPQRCLMKHQTAPRLSEHPPAVMYVCVAHFVSSDLSLVASIARILPVFLFLSCSIPNYRSSAF